MAINGQVIHERTDRLLPRQEAVEQINAMFGQYGIHLTCDFSRQIYNYGLSDAVVATPEDEDAQHNI